MATAELARPGVEVIQSVRRASPTFLRPTLAPVIVGSAFEVINAVTSDGAINPKAKWGAYKQLGAVISGADFPDPRGNIDEVVVQPDSVRPFLFMGGRLTELLMDPGQGFLTASHLATQARLAITGTSLAVQGKNIVLAVDQPTAADTTQDVTVVFPGSAPYSPADVVATINSAFGIGVASVTVDGNNNPTGVLLASPSFGAVSSLTVRAGGTANQVLGIGWDSNGSVGQEERVEGSGYRAYNLSNNTTQSPWVEFFRGDYLAGGVSSADSAWPTRASLKNVATGAVTHARAAAVTFGGSTMPLKAGDQLWADGVQLAGGEIAVVNSTRLRMGTINTALSVADANGRYTTKVYSDAPLGLTIDTAPFAPKYVWFKAAGLQPTTSATAASLTGSQAASPAATPASVEGTTAPDLSGGVVLAGLRIDYIVTVDGVASVGSFVFTSSSTYSSMANVAAAVSIPGVLVTNDTGKLKFTTSKTGAAQGIVIKGTSSAATELGLGADDLSASGADATVSGLTGENLRFTLDQGAHVYSVVFSSDSLDQAVLAINQLVGTTVAAKDGAGTHLVLTSTLHGIGSQVSIVDGSALTALGFTAAQTSTAATGRPNPDAYLDDSNSLVIGPDLVRDPVTGYPLDFDTSPASLYVQFKGLRRDVSSSASVPGIVNLPNVDTLTSVMDPVTEENPLAFGAYLALLNCPGFQIGALGVDETSAAAPYGTELAYARAAAFLEAQEVYAIAPLTQDEVVHQLFTTHATLMSEPEQMGERIVIYNKAMPLTAAPKTVASGTSASSTATANQLLVDTLPQPGLIGAGLNPAQPFTVAQGVYVELSWDGVFYRYNVSSVSGGLANLNLVFATGQNDDYFYSTVALPSGIVDAAWSMKVRGSSLKIAGSTQLDYAQVADAVATGNSGVGNRRAFSLFPDTIKTSVAGVEKELPGFFACAAVAGMIAGLPPQQGFTNYPMTGLTGIVGTEKFTKRQLNQMAGGGTYILMQEVSGGPVFCRHQLSTDASSVETRELSITKVVDFTAKFLRTGVRRFIGRQNISAVFLDTVGTTIQAMLAFLIENGILNGANLNNIIQDPNAPDTVMVDITLDVPYPCNYLRLTLVV